MLQSVELMNRTTVKKQAKDFDLAKFDTNVSIGLESTTIDSPRIDVQQVLSARNLGPKANPLIPSKARA
jgi:hypothetical protein